MKELYSKLEFDTVCNKIAEFASSEVVAGVIRNTEPTAYIEDAEKLLTQTADAIKILASKRPNLAFDDVEPIISKARVGAMLQPLELLKVKNSIAALRSLKSCVESADGCDSLKDITAWVRACEDLEQEIDRTVENATDLKDGASEKLYSLRRAIMRANAKLKERLEGYTRQNDVSKYLQDNIVTIRDGRYVVPVRAEYRSSVKGLVHDVSSTGATVFIEPFAIVEANNELKTLRTEEENEIERILIELGHSVMNNADSLSDGQRVLTECGVIFAKAEYAKKHDAYRPKLNDVGKISLIGARHPLIDAGSVVPVDISLENRKILLISGPNTGGKTVVLKTVGLFALMAASGNFLPTRDGSEICVFEQIFCDIGDSQSIEQSLSTFSAHINNIASIARSIDSRSLVLLDEVGGGTDPDEGAALAVAIMKKIIRVGATAVLTTHFNAVKEFAVSNDDVKNACMQFDSVNFRPTYRLLQGVTGSSYALEISEKLGLDPQIISDARAALSSEKIAFDRIMRETEMLRNEAARDKLNTEKALSEAAENKRLTEKCKDEYERKLNDLNENARNIIRKRADEYSERADALIEEIKENLKNADAAALFAARKTAAKIRDGVPSETSKPKKSNRPPKPEELADGVRVYVSGLNKEGLIVGKPRGDKAIVAIGQIKTELPISSLTVIAPEKTVMRTRNIKIESEPVDKEIMLIGKTVDEAVETLERIINDLPPKSTLRIVHGKGTGALGKGVQAYLKKVPRIKTFRYGGYGEGDTGVTIAEVK